MKTKAKVLTVILCLLAFVVACAVLFSTVFCVSSINIVWHTTTQNFTGKDAEIVESGGIKQGESIFLVAKEQSAKTLEQNYPYLKVLAVESVFPSKIQLHLIEREALFCSQIETNKYVVFDQDFKVLEIKNGIYSSTNKNPILLNVDLSGNELTIASFVENDLCNIFKTFQINFEKMDFNIVRQKAFIVDAQILNDRMILNTFSGVQIQIFAPKIRQQEKIAMALKVYQTLSASKKASGIVGVYENTEGVICGSHHN